MTSAPGVGRKVLLVDDDGDMRELLRTVLGADAGFVIVADAGSGEAALTEAARHHPDIVVLDLGLPDLEGRDVLTRLRTMLPSVNVVVYTGNEAARRDAAAWGADGFVSKAEELERLLGVLEDVAQTNSQIASLELAPLTSSPRTARQFIVGVLGRWQCDHLVDDACLVVSELVANAVLHARTASELRLSLRPGVLRIEVTDSGPGTPDPKVPSTQRGNGRGLHIVSAIASAWGVSPRTGGKLVWAELAA
jgi:DNA-binding NarL/FixJ family response regulator